MTEALHLVQLTDCHLLADPAREYHGWNTDQALQAVLAALGADGEPVDALLLTGDLVQDESPAGYARLREYVAGFGTPVWTLPGNHDSPAALSKAFGHAWPDRVTFGGWQLLLLNTHIPGRDQGTLGSVQLEWLEQALSAHREPALVCLHHPPLSMHSRWLDALGLDDGAPLLEQLARHVQVRAVVVGHVHQELDVQHARLRVLTTPATCRQFLPRTDRFAEDATRTPGYRRFYLRADGSWDTHVRRLPPSWRDEIRLILSKRA